MSNSNNNGGWGVDDLSQLFVKINPTAGGGSVPYYTSVMSPFPEMEVKYGQLTASELSDLRLTKEVADEFERRGLHIPLSRLNQALCVAEASECDYLLAKMASQYDPQEAEWHLINGVRAMLSHEVTVEKWIDPMGAVAVEEKVIHRLGPYFAFVDEYEDLGYARSEFREAIEDRLNRHLLGVIEWLGDNNIRGNMSFDPMAFAQGAFPIRFYDKKDQAHFLLRWSGEFDEEYLHGKASR